MSADWILIHVMQQLYVKTLKGPITVLVSPVTQEMDTSAQVTS